MKYSNPLRFETRFSELLYYVFGPTLLQHFLKLFVNKKWQVYFLADFKWEPTFKTSNIYSNKMWVSKFYYFFKIAFIKGSLCQENVIVLYQEKTLKGSSPTSPTVLSNIEYLSINEKRYWALCAINTLKKRELYCCKNILKSILKSSLACFENSWTRPFTSSAGIVVKVKEAATSSVLIEHFWDQYIITIF